MRFIIGLFCAVTLIACEGSISSTKNNNNNNGGDSNNAGGDTTLPANSAHLTWAAPQFNEDGVTPLTDLAGFRVHYGTAAGSYTQHVDVGNVTQYTVAGLASGTYYFAVTAYDTANPRNESGYSNEASKTIP